MSLIKGIVSQLRSDSLYRNSLYLMISTGVLGGFGFIFWIINARLYSSNEIGLATTLISVGVLITNLSLLGLNNGIIRFLPKSDNKNVHINTSVVLITGMTIVVSSLFLVFVPFISPQLLFIRSSFLIGTLFVIFMVFTSLNIFIESIFIAYRSTGYVLFKNIIVSVMKVLLPVVFISLGAFGIFSSVSIAYLVAVIVSIVILIIRFNYKIKILLHVQTIQSIWKFSFANYLAYFIGMLPSLILPVIITNKLGASLSAFFYIDMMIANLLYIIPIAATQSMFAEGSHDETTVTHHMNKAFLMIAGLLTPAVIITVVIGKYILMFFGKEYATGGIQLLQLLALTGIFSSINYVGNALLNIHNKVTLLITINVANAFLILGFSYLFIAKGLLGIGFAFLISQIIIGVFQAFIILRQYK